MKDERGYQPDFDADERQASQSSGIKVAIGVASSLISSLKIRQPPVDIEAIVRERGLTLKKADVAGALSGQLYPVDREIFVNTRGRSVSRQRFTVAHELGHWELRHYERDELPPDGPDFDGPYGDADGRLVKDPREVEANAFAAELLMPRAWLRKLKRPLSADEPDRLANLYQVSREAMFYQLMTCRMLA